MKGSYIVIIILFMILFIENRNRNIWAKQYIQKKKGNALLVEKKGTLEAVNLDFVVRIREYPRKKNGKKNSLVVD